MSWSSASTVVSYHFPQDLFSAGSYISSLMTNFKYFYAKGVRILLRLSSTPFHQGALMVGWVPDTTTALTAPDIQQLSCCQPVILSASTQDTATIDIPWLAAIRKIKLSEVAPREIGSLFIRPLVALVSPVGASSTIEVSVYAQFIEPQVDGYIYNASLVKKQASNKNRFSPEASTKDSKGIDAKGIVSTVSKVVRTAPIVGGIWGTIADVVNSIAGDLSKPTSNQAHTKVLQQPYENLSLASGESFPTPLSLYPNATMEQQLTMYGMETSHMTLAKIAQKPMLFDLYPLNATTPTYTTQVDPIVSGTLVGNPDYFKYIVYAHSRWRGSMKYSFYFCCNAFYTTRVRISIDYGTSASSISEKDDIPHKIVEIKGDTWHDVTIPFMRQFDWIPTGLATDAPNLTIALEAPIVGENLPLTPTIYLCIFRSAAEDVQFSKLQNAKPVTPFAFRGPPEKQVSLVNRFASAFPPILEGCTFGTESKYITPETTSTASDCLKRWSYATSASVAGITRYTYPCLQTTAANNSYYEPYHYFARLFKYWRGSRRSLHCGTIDNTTINYPTNGVTPSTAAGFPGYGLDFALVSTTTTKQAIEVPWYSELPYQNNNRSTVAYPANPNDIYRNGAFASDEFFVSGGDDFVCMHLLWPINTTITDHPQPPAPPTSADHQPTRTTRTQESLHFSPQQHVSRVSLPKPVAEHSS
jgi:hypothetical protein